MEVCYIFFEVTIYRKRGAYPLPFGRSGYRSIERIPVTDKHAEFLGPRQGGVDQASIKQLALTNRYNYAFSGTALKRMYR